MKIPIYWWEGIAGLYSHEGKFGRSRYACCGLLNSMFDSYDCIHHSGYDNLKNEDFAIVLIHGGHLRNQVEEINQSIAHLSAVICIGMGDEENDFPYRELRHRNMKVWVQSPVPGKSWADRFLAVGYPCDCIENLVHGQMRVYDFSFAGQVTHIRRKECIEAVRNLRNGFLYTTDTFYSGLPHDEYFKILGQSKVVLCPSGPVCSDTFRLYEGLEAGCLIVADKWPGWKDKPTDGIWEMLFPNGYPFPAVNNWNEFPNVLQNLLDNYEVKQKEVSSWWAAYKQDYYSWLRTDLRALGVSI
jgi:glycosyltransferase involved in cell wall biosynthesis